MINFNYKIFLSEKKYEKFAVQVNDQIKKITIKCDK